MTLGPHPGYVHRVKWWFLRRTTEYRRCQRIAAQWNAWSIEHEAETGTPGLQWTPGMVWTLRNPRVSR